MIGIGGISMSGIAKLLLQQGIRVSGSDTTPNSLTYELISKGAKIYYEHKADNINNSIDLVIHSSAIKENNPEICVAKKLNIPIWKRAKMLKELIKNKKSIAVTGTHGKTTVSFIITHILKEAGYDPSFLIGGEVDSLGGNAHIGKGDLFVVEADESDGSNVYLEPDIAVITNIDRDHLEYYKDIFQIRDVITKFASKVSIKGSLIGWGKDTLVEGVLKNTSSKIKKVKYGFDGLNDIYAVNVSLEEWNSQFDIIYKNKLLFKATLGVPGKHNVLNSLAGILAAIELGINPEVIKKALKTFKGVKRRLEIIYRDKDLLVINDYAHHPREIKAVLDVFRNRKNNRLIGIFQPHRFTRTKYLYSEFAEVFGNLDLLILTDIYSAGELPIEGVNGRLIFDKVKNNANLEVEYLEFRAINDFLETQIKPNDIIIFLGAGDVIDLAQDFKQRLINIECKI